MWMNLEFVGRVGRDPQMRYMPSGQAVCNFSVAVDTGRDESKHSTWFQVSCFGKTAEFATKHVHVGKRVLVMGVLNSDIKTGNPRMWQRQDGTAGASYDVWCNELRIIDWENDDGNVPQPQADTGQAANVQQQDEQDQQA